jgi:hypothetical protein
VRIFVDGSEVKLPEINEYWLGPLRIRVRSDLAAAYNRIIRASREAKEDFEKIHRFPWEPSFDRDLYHYVYPEDVRIFKSFGSLIESAASLYQGPPIPLDELQDVYLILISEEW